jgi:hypothetical protein
MTRPPDDIAVLRVRLAAAKWRCEHPTGPNRAYAGVTFEFASPAMGARLLLGKLGPIPPRMSLDRIDPRGPYSLDNLRYATPLLQVLNRRRKSSISLTRTFGSHWTHGHG